GNIAISPTSKDFELIVVKNDELQELNKEYRTIDKPTDVLSFPMNVEVIDRPLLGSLVLSTDLAQEKAKEFKHSSNVESTLA
ncbi:rRNA maturation RNase YbeY, partial [Aliarcobacter butzleri]|uniref:rRNA maturation RNase YbeY n=1 Tax=Aliarcobacter butzleri TaxID=28197 RepID=UPI003AF44D36